ncbi:hypothetical protein ACF0H5_012578 [Mactra antiquata]
MHEKIVFSFHRTMDGSNVLVLFFILLLLDYVAVQVTIARNTCGRAEVIEPAIKDRTVALNFVPFEHNSKARVVWKRRGGRNPWADLEFDSKFKMHKDNNQGYYLIISDAKLSLDDVEYQAEFITEDKSCTSNSVMLELIASPSSVVLSPLTSTDFCSDCIIGNDKSQINVTCTIIGGSKPYAVTLHIGDFMLSSSRPISDDKYVETLKLNETFHGLQLTCSVVNNAIYTPMTATATIYVKRVQQIAPSLIMPDVLLEGENVDIKCMVKDRRPPATNISIWMDNEKITIMGQANELNDTTDLFDSYITLNKFHRHWNQKQVKCCEHSSEFNVSNRTICSDPKIANFHFPPDNVSLFIDNTSVEDKSYYFLRARCLMANSFPQCNVTWNTTGRIVSEGIEHITVGNENNVEAFTAFINISIDVTLGVLTCTPKCEDTFKELPNKSLFLPLPPRPGQLEFNTSRDVSVMRGDTISITCTSISNTPATISWYEEHNTQVPCTENITEQFDPPNFSVLYPPESSINKMNICTMKFHANTSLDSLRFYCQACNEFGCNNETLTVTVTDTTSDDVDNKPEDEDLSESFWPLPIEILASIAGGIVMIIIITIVVACKCRNQRGKENDIPLNEVNNEIIHEEEPLPENEAQRQLFYADLEFHAENSSNIISSRESNVEYDEVDFTTSATKAMEVKDAVDGGISTEQEEGHFYVNQE